LEAAFPSALVFRFTGRGDAVAVAGGVAARRVERGVRRPRLGALRQRQLAAHRHPDAIGILGVDAAERAPRPTVVRMPRVGQPLWPGLDHLLMASRPVLVTPSLGATT